ncbi:MAG TPA: formyltransferase family protein, partial [Bacteroidia bacterium]|nr:formyltransferase family protein [Bacteroidia bacterium]
NIDLIVLAGFLWMMPKNLIHAFPEKIINIHPALLPKFGGKGMYGMNVHKAVIAAKEKESGISIHYVNEKYDEGKIIVQHKCEVSENDTADTLAEKIHELEYNHFPKAIEELLSNK